MFSKSFEEMRSIDVSPYTSKRDGIEYLPWANCKRLLHDNGAEKVYFTPLSDPNTGSSLFMSDIAFIDKNGVANRCYEVAVEIVIDDMKFIMRTPVMNGANPVKDNSMSQQRVWAAQARAFVKGVAIHTGLGFDLWLKDYDEAYDEDLSRHKMYKIKERVQEEYTECLVKKKLSVKQIAEKMGMTEDEVKVYFTYYDMLESFEKKLLAI